MSYHCITSYPMAEWLKSNKRVFIAHETKSKLGGSKPSIADLDWARSWVCNLLVGQLQAPHTHLEAGWLWAGVTEWRGHVFHHSASQLMHIHLAAQESSKGKSSTQDVLGPWLGAGMLSLPLHPIHQGKPQGQPDSAHFPRQRRLWLQRLPWDNSWTTVLILSPKFVTRYLNFITIFTSL